MSDLDKKRASLCAMLNLKYMMDKCELTLFQLSEKGGPPKTKPELHCVKTLNDMLKNKCVDDHYLDNK